MAQIEAVFVFCSPCKILYFASSVHPKNATDLALWQCFDVAGRRSFCFVATSHHCSAEKRFDNPRDSAQSQSHCICL